METIHTSGSPYYAGEAGDTAFRWLSTAVQATLDDRYEESGGTLFSIDTEGLFDRFLESFDDPVERQFHNCHCCRSFIKRYGGLLRVSEIGDVRSAVWDPRKLSIERIPKQYHRVVNSLKHYVEAMPVVDLFLWKDETHWGVPEAGGFRHFSVVMPADKCEAHLTPNQAMAVRREDRKHLAIACVEMKPAHVDRAIAMLEAGGLSRPETLLPMAKFLQQVQARVKVVKGEDRNRVLWHYVGKAARGWCTPRASAFGSLVEAIAAGRSVETITRAHNSMMDPTQYQRPQAPPSAGNIKQAEKIFEQLGLASALRRRPMALEEVPEFIWTPRTPKPAQSGGLFGHLQPKGMAPIYNTPLNVKTAPMTFAKFQRDVLPNAIKMQIRAPSHGAYCAFTTAVDPTAQPIFKWDELGRRNAAAWYVYSHGSAAHEWGFSMGEPVDVLGLTKLPPDWGGGTFFKALTIGRVLVIMKGAVDRKGSAMGLFPECMKSELHSVRATIEAHARSSALEDEQRPRASGFLIHDHGENLRFEVTTDHGVANYVVDRLE